MLKPRSIDVQKSILAVALLGALYTGTPDAWAAEYQIRVPANVASAPEPSVPKEEIQVTLEGASLPAAMAGKAYEYDFSPRLSITGVPEGYSLDEVGWSLKEGSAVPAGLSLNESGILAGTPTAMTPKTDFTVIASYKGKSGENIYTIVVGDAVLNVSQIDAGDYHTCAITTDSKVKCWGSNTDYQLGDGTTTKSSLPVDVKGLPGRALSIDAGGRHTCALVETGMLYCWGLNYSGQLGDGTNERRLSPVRAGTLTNVVQFSAGADHTCAVTNLGAAWCWGYNGHGRIGNGDQTGYRATPYAVNGLSSGVRMISAGGENSCAVMTNGTAKCWGAGIANASLDSYNKTAPSDVKLSNNTPLTSVQKIDVGYRHACALLTSGALKCWGNTSEYPIGNGTFGQFSPAMYAADVIGLPEPVNDIDAGYTHTCAKTVSGKMLCWGSNRMGQLGRTIGGTATATPGYVTGLNGSVVAISAGRDQTCAITDSGNMKCWGANAEGQVGDGSFTQRNQPVNVKP